MKTFLQKVFLLALVLLGTSVSFSQKKQVEKANKEFDKYAYIDARDIYLKVVEDGYTSAQIYKNLGDTYYWNSDYDNAAKWYSRLISEFPQETEVNYYYRAAQSQKSLGNADKSKEYMDMYISKGGDPGIVRATATDFLEYEVVLEKVSVNTAYSDFGPAYYMDKLVYASSSNTSEGSKIAQWNEQPFLDLYEADMDGEGKLSNASSLSGDVNTPYHESTPTFTKDGNTIYFTRNNYIDGKKGKDKNKTIRLKLYKATKSGDNYWTNVVELPFNSKEYSVAHPALSLDEKRLYFSSDMPGTIGMSDLWYVDILDNDSYGEPVNLGTSINTEARESFPFISEKNNLYFSSDGRGGLGGYDIFSTPLNPQGRPGKITNLGEPANSSQDDFGFIIKEEKRMGYMSSNREGAKGSIDDEIYLVQEKCEIVITGTVFDQDSKELLPGAEVLLLDSNNKIVDSQIVGETASYSFNADCEKQYSVRGSKTQYAPYEKVLQTPDKSGTVEIPIPLKLVDPCPPNDLGCRLKLQPIYFDFDRYNIRPDAAIELAKILAAMRQYPELIIHIESHTDSRGNDKYNESLSDKRAQSTLQWLVDKGIAKSRLTAKGYGEYKLTNKCDDGVECTEEEHQLNRRSMFIIQN
ncbi:outer membrane protein OmpA-like peptidoglycan-associated protein [Ulvibacter sp. MAR_2010_11]|uniref:OmpA family protein n=1 Tax=Ulvibacter sp. MAR_2010_11 TaxID=1250229 RepID=UPI000C2C9A6A|nr:OmpA family protein [Ulvibacter sp. MAR_2010_11]PKA83672.1 outer membrane protein OmpA-like peptidoglycan-associated protein [Ulvibacter sp. MAR_2010_11]PKA83676.1 outer membrane protein OmpA-like peptidoglycan-associated protein [Ulvibacter sp. MAR_2010_11]